MIKAEEFLEMLLKLNLNFFCGVPDSLLSPLNLAIDMSAKAKHITAVNEGAAVGIAIGHHLATKKVPVVYMQNSGLGNALNPLISLADGEVYGIPMLLIIGWRGELQDGIQQMDEPQHKKQGKVTLPQLAIADINYSVISSDTVDWRDRLRLLIECSVKKSRPVAVVVRSNTFSFEGRRRIHGHPRSLSREGVIEKIVREVGERQIFISTTGKISREIVEIRARLGHEAGRDFLCIGGMGHASSIAVGLSIGTDDRIICLDGDGSVLMHLGALAEVAKQNNLIHVVLNNGCHESVGGQPTCALEICLCDVARALKYDNVIQIDSEEQFADFLRDINTLGGSSFLEIRCKPGSRDDLGRPEITPIESKKRFMQKLITGE